MPHVTAGELRPKSITLVPSDCDKFCRSHSAANRAAGKKFRKSLKNTIMPPFPLSPENGHNNFYYWSGCWSEERVNGCGVLRIGLAGILRSTWQAAGGVGGLSGSGSGHRLRQFFVFRTQSARCRSRQTVMLPAREFSAQIHTAVILFPHELKMEPPVLRGSGGFFKISCNILSVFLLVIIGNHPP